MPFGSRADDVTFGLQLANLCSQFRNVDPLQALNAGVSAMGMNLTGARFSQATATRPAGYVADDGTNLVWLFDGAQTLEHGQSYLRCMSDVDFKLTKGWCSGRLADLALDLRDEWITIGGVMRDRMFFVGHSFGGALSTALAACLYNTDRPLDTTIITFGAPRSGGSIFTGMMQHADVRRYMCNDDPVPLLPPGRLEVGNYVLTIHPNDLINWSRFCHLHGGCQVNLQGLLSASTTPGNVTVPQTISVARWIYSLARTVDHPHNLQTYITRLAIAVTNAANTNFPTVPKPPAEVQHVLPKKQAQAFVNQVVHAQAPVLNNQTNSHVRLPRQNLAFIERTGRVWSVSFGGSIIASGLSRTAARRLRDSMNTFLRRLQNQGMVDADTLRDQFLTYLDLATDPSTGFEPQLNVVDLG